MATSTPSEIQNAISTLCENFQAAYNIGDAKGLAELYTESGQILPPNYGVVEGGQAIQEFWQGAMDFGLKSAKFKLVEIEAFGDAGYLVGKYEMYDDEEQLVDEGKWVSIFKMVEGKWKVHRDIWSTNLPLPE